MERDSPRLQCPSSCRSSKGLHWSPHSQCRASCVLSLRTSRGTDSRPALPSGNLCQVDFGPLLGSRRRQRGRAGSSAGSRGALQPNTHHTVLAVSISLRQLDQLCQEYGVSSCGRSMRRGSDLRTSQQQASKGAVSGGGGGGGGAGQDGGGQGGGRGGRGEEGGGGKPLQHLVRSRRGFGSSPGRGRHGDR